MPKIEIYTKHWCPYCRLAKEFLRRRGLHYTEVEISDDPRRASEMLKRSNRRTVPQIFIDGTHVGGSDDLLEADRSGHLDALLAGSTANA